MHQAVVKSFTTLDRKWPPGALGAFLQGRRGGFEIVGYVSGNRAKIAVAIDYPTRTAISVGSFSLRLQGGQRPWRGERESQSFCAPARIHARIFAWSVEERYGPPYGICSPQGGVDSDTFS